MNKKCKLYFCFFGNISNGCRKGNPVSENFVNKFHKISKVLCAILPKFRQNDRKAKKISCYFVQITL